MRPATGKEAKKKTIEKQDVRVHHYNPLLRDERIAFPSAIILPSTERASLPAARHGQIYHYVESPEINNRSEQKVSTTAVQTPLNTTFYNKYGLPPSSTSGTTDASSGQIKDLILQKLNDLKRQVANRELSIRNRDRAQAQLSNEEICSVDSLSDIEEQNAILQQHVEPWENVYPHSANSQITEPIYQKTLHHLHASSPNCLKGILKKENSCVWTSRSNNNNEDFIDVFDGVSVFLTPLSSPRKNVRFVEEEMKSIKSFTQTQMPIKLTTKSKAKSKSKSAAARAILLSDPPRPISPRSSSKSPATKSRRKSKLTTTTTTKESSTIGGASSSSVVQDQNVKIDNQMKEIEPIVAVPSTMTMTTKVISDIPNPTSEDQVINNNDVVVEEHVKIGEGENSIKTQEIAIDDDEEALVVDAETENLEREVKELWNNSRMHSRGSTVQPSSPMMLMRPRINTSTLSMKRIGRTPLSVGVFGLRSASSSSANRLSSWSNHVRLSSADVSPRVYPDHGMDNGYVGLRKTHLLQSLQRLDDRLRVILHDDYQKRH